MKLPPHPKYMSKDFEKCEVKLMKQHLEDYLEVIKQLPLKKKYTKDELLIPELLVEKYGDIEIYYAPHNEYLNPKAKIFIVAKDKAVFENCTLTNVKLTAGSTGYGAIAYVYANDGSPSGCFNEVPGVTITNCTK